MKMVLLDKLDEVLPRIGRLDDGVDARAFASVLRERRPEAFSGLDEADTARAAEAIAVRCIGEIRKIPELAAFLRRKLDDYGVPPSSHAGIAFALAYLVCPVELLADDLPGGYGFVDDSIMLCALAGAVLMEEPDAKARFEQVVGAIEVLGMGLPRDLAPLLRDAADDAMRTVFALGHIPRALLEELTRQYIEYPARKIIEAVRNLMVAREAPARPLPEGAAFFDLPGGRVGRSADGSLIYTFEGGLLSPADLA